MSIVELAEAARPSEAASSLPFVRTRRAGFEVIEDLAAVESLWRSFENEAICSPYQRFDWVQSFARALAATEGFGMRALLVRDGGRRPLLLLPLALRRRHGVTIASFVGGKQANFNLPIAAPGLSSVLPPSELKRILIEAGRERLQADGYIFLNQPLSWRGEPNPLAAFAGSPSANEGYMFSLSSKPEETLARGFSGETRKKMRKKRRLLGDLGEVRFFRASDRAEAEAILTAFFEQKARRFRALGIDNPFDGPMQAFIRQGSLTGLDRGHPAIELYALSAGERIIATFGGAGDRSRLCGMFNSFDTADDVTRCSPGELLLADVIRHQCELGREVFDLGVGEARYKTSLCDQVEPLIDVFMPVTPQGRIHAMAVERLAAAKRYVKQTPWAMRTLNTVRTSKVALLG